LTHAAVKIVGMLRGGGACGDDAGETAQADGLHRRDRRTCMQTGTRACGHVSTK
jgi:hypothetical protein